MTYLFSNIRQGLRLKPVASNENAAKAHTGVGYCRVRPFTPITLHIHRSHSEEVKNHTHTHSHTRNLPQQLTPKNIMLLLTYHTTT